MKIRTITTGATFSQNYRKQLDQLIEFNNSAKDTLGSSYEIQTTRICSQPWSEYTKPEQVVEVASDIEKICKSNNVDEASIGTVLLQDKNHIKFIPKIIQATEIVSTSAVVAEIHNGIDEKAVSLASRAIKEIAQKTKHGYGNFRFGALANCPPGIPFFPAAYHAGKTSFAIGLECGDLAVKAFSNAKNIKSAEEQLRKIFQKEVSVVETLCKQLEKKEGITYRGIDVSLNPGLLNEESVAFAFEKLGFGKFGSPGTLAIAEMITRTLKSINVKQCGYSGLMLPILEDKWLAKRSDERTFNLNNLLLYSSVCGCGLDTIPIPSDTNVKIIENIVRDVAALAIRLNKPLSARIFVVPNLKAGQKTNFKSPYMTDCRVLDI